MGDTGDVLSQYSVRLASFQRLITDNQASDSYCQQTRVGNNTKQTVSVSARTSFIKLARAGFYYAGPVEGIKCFVCKSKARYKNWHKESPVAVHRILNPHCPFLQLKSSSRENNSTIIQSPTDGVISNHCCTNSQQPDSPTQLQEPSDTTTTGDAPNHIRPDETPPNCGANENTTLHSMNSVRRNLFSPTPASNQANVNVDENSTNVINNPTNNIRSRSQWCDHAEEYTGRIIHPRIGDKVFNAYESFRILTFPDPQDEKAAEWAVHGFVYIGNDNVQCVYCAGVTSYQEQLNIIRDVHEKISPKGRYYCPMVSGIDVGNVSRKLEELVRNKLIDKNNRSKNMKNSFPVLHPQFRKTEERLTSFEHWSKQYKPTKTQLAEAGFFYTGVGTKVVCFCCGLSIRDWEPTADPWQQHALISSTCTFIKHIKGEEFIQQMAAIQQLVEVDPSVTEPVTSIGELNIPDPYPPTLSTTLLAAYSTCGYNISTTQLLHLIQQFFINTCGRYPSVDMLKAAVLADGELKKKDDMLDLKDEVIQTKDRQLDNLDQVMTGKDQYYKATVTSLNQHHNIVIDCKEQELIHKDQELYQLSQHYRCTRRQLRQHIREKDEHIDNLSNRLQTAVDQHRAREDNLQQTLQQQIYIHQTELQRQETELQRQETELQRQETELQRRETELQRQETEFERQRTQLQRYEEELSNLVTELTRLRSTVNNRENQPENQHDSPAVNQPDSPALNQSDQSAINPDRCLICLSETRMVLFRPCKHVCCCTTCAPRFKDSPCPVCRTHVQDWEIVFLS